MSEPTVVDARLDKLERDNRRLKLTVGALLLVLAAAAVPLVGVVMPQQIPELIQARQFQVIDESGDRRVVMNSAGIVYHDEYGRERAVMNQRGFFYNDW